MLIVGLIISTIFICVFTLILKEELGSLGDAVAFMFALLGIFVMFIGSIIGLMR